MAGSADVWNDAAKSLEYQQNSYGASLCYERARSLGDESPQTCLNLARSQLKLYEFYDDDRYLASAKVYLLAAIEKDSENPALHHYLGIVYLELGEKSLAAQEFFTASEKHMQSESDLALEFDAGSEEPSVYSPGQSEVYDLLPDPALYKLFDLLKGSADTTLLEGLRKTYGNKQNESLIALYLRSIYYKIFGETKFSDELGLTTPNLKWESLIVFFIRGINNESSSLVKDSISGGRLDMSKLPIYTRLLIGRYRNEISSSSYDREGLRALVALPLLHIGAVDKACGLISEGEMRSISPKEAISGALLALLPTGYAIRTKQGISLSGSFLRGAVAIANIDGKLKQSDFDSELLLQLSVLLRARRFELASSLAKRIRGLYEPAEAQMHINDILSTLSLDEDEKEKILSG